MSEEKIYQVALSMVPGIGDINARKLVSYCGSAREVFDKSKSRLSKIPGIGTLTSEAILKFHDFSRAEKEIEKCEARGYEVLFFTDDAYPANLKQAPDSPIVLYYQGTGSLSVRKIVSIVGTRNATRYGKGFVESIVADLKAHNALIVSGLAYGIDIHAHRIALECGLQSVGVMASGLDIVYPREHTSIAKRMSGQGGLLSETPVGTQPEAHFFPARNRIIAGIADAVIVVEAAERGGALITAEIANSYSRDVFALPGNTDRKYSTGCNSLIKQNKAHLITDIRDLEYVMNWNVAEKQSDLPRKELDLSDLDRNAASVLKILQEHEGGIMIDDLSWRVQIPLNRLASNLLELEFKGLIKSLPGKKYRVI